MIVSYCLYNDDNNINVREFTSKAPTLLIRDCILSLGGLRKCMLYKTHKKMY